MLTIQPTTASLMSLLIDIVSSSSPLGSFVVGPPSLAGWASRAGIADFHECSLGCCRCRQRGPRRDGVRFRSLPMTAPRIWRGLQDARPNDAADQSGMEVVLAPPARITPSARASVE